MTDNDRIEALIHEIIELAKEVRRVSNSQKRISVSLMTELSSIENRALASAKLYKKEYDAAKPTFSNKKH